MVHNISKTHLSPLHLFSDSVFNLQNEFTVSVYRLCDIYRKYGLKDQMKFVLWNLTPDE